MRVLRIKQENNLVSQQCIPNLFLILIIGERQEYEFCTILEEHIPYSRHYNPLILDPKIEEFPCLVHKLSVQTSTSTNTNRSTYNINRSEKRVKKIYMLRLIMTRVRQLHNLQSLIKWHKSNMYKTLGLSNFYLLF